MRKILVTRHEGLKKFLVNKRIVPEDIEVLSHVTPEKEDLIKGSHVYGVIPLWLAAMAYRVTEVKLDIPPEFRGKELTEEQMEKFFCGVVTYDVKIADIPELFVGDKIHIKNVQESLDLNGVTGTVTRIINEKIGYTVTLDTSCKGDCNYNPGCYGGMNCSFFRHELELM